jgi:hypothetical protein
VVFLDGADVLQEVRLGYFAYSPPGVLITVTKVTGGRAPVTAWR